MRVFLTGATGFLGRAMTLALRREGHEVLAWVRNEARARAQLGDQAELVSSATGPAGLRAALERADAVVNLAGEPVLSRWTAARKAALRSSRVDLTAQLVRALEEARPRPRVLVSGSAVGFYGDRGDQTLSESSPGGEGFLPLLCRDWEETALRAESLGVRVVVVRTGVVLGLDGGALVSMLPPFRLGLGGRLSSGRQFMPWIHVEDWVRIVLAALGDERYRGALNATAPTPLDNRAFTRILARTVGRSAPFPVPSLGLRLLFGGAASILLESQRAVPERLRQLGFRHAFPGLEEALDDLLRAGRTPLAALPGAAHQLARETRLEVPRDEAFAFFSSPENLGLLTPRAMGLRITARSGPPTTGSTIDYGLRLGPVRLRWRTRFEAWEPPLRFVDVQERGPYASWRHEHVFEADGNATRMHDRVAFRMPFGPLGRLALRLLVADSLADIFAHRNLAIRLRFGAGGGARVERA